MKTDIHTASSAVDDRGEIITRMEPLRLRDGSRHRTDLTDMSVELAMQSTGFRRSLPDGLLMPLATLVRAMNCYYSNLIEGHDTHPLDIERALKDDYSTDTEKRNLQLEAKAHIEAQEWIDGGGLVNRAVAVDSLVEIHRRFCERLPEDLLWVEGPHTEEPVRVVPGAFRKRDVQVGRHLPISPGAVPRFLQRFAAVYGNLGTTDTILASAAAHHRLLWIHPFLDGNGRVARLMSYALFRETLDTGGVWSVARGLARHVADYKRGLAACDQSRRGDLDGRGNLSEEALADFTRFFLGVCIDQVKFMEGLIAPERLRNRILVWAEEEVRAGALPPRSGAVLEAVLFRGSLPRADVPGLLGIRERQARRVTSTLLEREVLASQNPRAPLHLAFPAKLASRWLPGLFPEG
ncbi:MAG: Fic family protein [Candidatus Tectomicrobia bacterium]|nr:Fic family protein [Candidatus Tectomicrobia bacterium]